MRMMLYPYRAPVSDEQLLSWARDLEADGDIEGGFGDDVDEAIRQLEDGGYVTMMRP